MENGGEKAIKNSLISIFNPKQQRKGILRLLAAVLAVVITTGLVACSAGIAENKLLTNLGYSETLLADIISNKTIFSSDKQQIEHIVQLLPLQSYRKYNSFSLQTEPLKEISIIYEIDDTYHRGGNGLDPFPTIVEENNALLLFAAIEGLDQVNFLSYDDQKLKELNRSDSYTIADLTMRFGNITPLNMGLSDLYNALGTNIYLSEFYFAHYSRIYWSCPTFVEAPISAPTKL